MTTPENGHALIGLFKSNTRAILKSKIDELRLILIQASETFKSNQMTTFAQAAKILSGQEEWQKNDIARAQCMALYHMYLMFYRDPECLICQKFLRRITTCYSKALKNRKHKKQNSIDSSPPSSTDVSPPHK